MSVTDNKNMMVSGWGKKGKHYSSKEYYDTQVLQVNMIFESFKIIPI